MREDSKCFIKMKNGMYEEITYKELEKRREKNKKYNNKTFIPVQGMLLEVSANQYKDFYRVVEKHKYNKKVSNKLKILSINELADEEDNDEEKVRGKDFIADSTCDVEGQVEKKIEIEELRNALLELNENEYQLINALFYEEKTVREYAKTKGISHVAIMHQKERTLKKLKKFLKF